MTASPVLTISSLTAGYGGAPVVRDINLEIRKSEVIVMLGANGAGKTTVLRAVSGLLRSEGVIEYEGEDLTSATPSARARAGVAHVPDGRGLFFGLTVEEHFRLHHRGERLDEEVAYNYFPALEPLRRRRSGLLSGGEQQMLALGRALARRPRLLLIDEMSMGLAPVMVQRLLPVVQRYAKESGCGVLIVEQHVHLALGIADRGYILSHGDVVGHGSAAELQADRALLVASYLGEQRTA